MFAPNARSVDTPAYLRALWALCEAQAAAAGVEARWCARRPNPDPHPNPNPKPKPKPKPNLTLSLTTGQVALVAQALDLLAAQLEPVGGIISGAGRELLRCAAASRPDRLEVVVEG